MQSSSWPVKIGRVGRKHMLLKEKEEVSTVLEVVDRVRGVGLCLELKKKVNEEFILCSVQGNENEKEKEKENMEKEKGRYFVKRKKSGSWRKVSVRHRGLADIRLYNLEEKKKKKKKNKKNKKKMFLFNVYTNSFNFEYTLLEFYREKIKIDEQDLLFLIEEVLGCLQIVHSKSEFFGHLSLSSVLIGDNFRSVRLDPDVPIITKVSFSKLSNLRKDPSVLIGGEECDAEVLEVLQRWDYQCFGKTLEKYTKQISEKYGEEVVGLIGSLVGCKSAGEFSRYLVYSSMKGEVVGMVKAFFGSLDTMRSRKRRSSKEQKEENDLTYFLVNFEKYSEKYHQIRFFRTIRQEVGRILEKRMDPLTSTMTVASLEKDSLLTKWWAQFSLALKEVCGRLQRNFNSNESESCSSILIPGEMERLFNYNPKLEYERVDVRCICSCLSIKKSLSTRLVAIEEVERLNISELLFNQNWGYCIKQLSSALSDSCPRIMNKVFKLHVSLYKFSPFEQSFDIMLSLSGHLIHVFRSLSLGSFARMGHYREVFQRTQRKFRFLLFMLDDLKKWWLAFYDKQKSLYFDTVFTLLSLKVPQLSNLFTREFVLNCPLFYVSFLDPGAEWARNWFRNGNIRKEYLKHYLGHFAMFSRILQVPSLVVGKVSLSDKVVVGNIRIFYYLLTHSVVVVGNLLAFRETSKPFKKAGEWIATHLVNYFEGKSVFQWKGLSLMAKLCSNIVKVFENGIEYSPGFLESRTLGVLLSPVGKRKKKKKYNRCQMCVLVSVMRIVNGLVRRCGCKGYRKLLLGRKKKFSPSPGLWKVIRFIFQVVSSKSEEEEDLLLVCCSVLKNMLKISDFNKIVTKFVRRAGYCRMVASILQYSRKRKLVESMAYLFFYSNGSFILSELQNSFKGTRKYVGFLHRVVDTVILLFDSLEYGQILSQITLFLKGDVGSALVGAFSSWKQRRFSEHKLFPPDEFKCTEEYRVFELLISVPGVFCANDTVATDIVSKYILGKDLANDEYLRWGASRKYSCRVLLPLVRDLAAFGSLERQFALSKELKSEKGVVWGCMESAAREELKNEIGRWYLGTRKVVLSGNTFGSVEEYVFGDDKGDGVPLEWLKSLLLSQSQQDVVLATNKWRNQVEGFLKGLEQEEKGIVTFKKSLLYCGLDPFVCLLGLIVRDSGGVMDVISRCHRNGQWRYLALGGNSSKFCPLERLRVYQMVEIILKMEFPTVWAYLFFNGIHILPVVESWMANCFLNHLQLSEVLKVLAMVTTGAGIHPVVYVLVSCLVHLQTCLQSAGVRGLPGYRLQAYAGMIRRLRAKYRKVCEKLLK